MDQPSITLTRWNPRPPAISPEPGIRLGRGELATLDGLKGNAILCMEGRLWITLQGDTHDYVLEPGERLVIPDDGKIVLSGPGSYRFDGRRRPARWALAS